MKKIALLSTLILAYALNAKAQNVPSYVPTTGLIGWWTLNGNAADSSGNSNNGTVNGASLTADRNGNANSAYSFNGTSNYIALPNGLSNNLSAGKVSAAAWVYFASNATWASVIKNWGSVSKGAYHLGLSDASQKLNIQVAQANTTAVAVTATAVTSLNAWHHVAFTADGSLVHLYQDGVEVGTAATYNGTLLTSFMYTNIGAKPSTTNIPANFAGYLDGKIDNIGLWSEALTSQQINDLFNEGQPAGLNKRTNATDISIYPNPAKADVFINLNQPVSHAEYVLYDALGNEIFQNHISSPTFQLSLNDLPKGMYFLEIRNNARIIRKKLSKE
ncbi:MAG: T9SS type A sorting domain-containing protein [Bacteroidetes bacterium]|nr:T9SS type A sorting domain-containing protein [Bacteroidota bacterium]